MILARHFDRAFQRLGTRVLEKYSVGKTRRAEPVRQLLAFGDPVEIGDVPDLVRLLGQRLDQLRMRVAECINGNAGGKIEVALTLGREQPSALAPLESEITRA